MLIELTIVLPLFSKWQWYLDVSSLRLSSTACFSLHAGIGGAGVGCCVSILSSSLSRQCVTFTKAHFQFKVGLDLSEQDVGACLLYVDRSNCSERKGLEVN